MQRFFGTLAILAALCCATAYARGTVPTFTRDVHGQTLTFAGHDPAKAGTTSIPTLLVPIRLTFANQSTVLDAAASVPRLLASPVFSDYRFAAAGDTQYGNALLQATFPGTAHGRTLLARPRVEAITIHVPASRGYLLHARHGAQSFAIVDSRYLVQQLARQIPKQTGTLVIAVTLNTAFYAMGDATVCCSWGTHGVDPATGNSFVLGSYLHDAPSIVTDRNIQPLTQQLAEFIYDPLHNPGEYFKTANAAGNFLAAWRRPIADGGCGGEGIGTNYFLLDPTDTNLKNNFPASAAYVARSKGFDYHLQNVALLRWYPDSDGGAGPYSFPDTHALTKPAERCSRNGWKAAGSGTGASSGPAPFHGARGSHWLIGYWTGSRYTGGKPFPIRDVAPQWDVVIAAFAPPAENGPPGAMTFAPPPGITPAELKAGIAQLQRQGRKVLISLGGGGKYFKLDKAADVPNFVSSVARIVRQYGFNGVDIDFESPSLELIPGDTDFKHPTTPSVVNLIAGLRELRREFGPKFMLSLVPEGTQVSGGFVTYSGQFGSELPLIYALRNILSFVDVQEYNTPPLQGLDGNIYQTHGVDYNAAMTELLLHGFNVARNPRAFFPPLPADKVAVGFLTGYDTPAVVSQSLRYIMTGKRPPTATYQLREARGYPAMLGAMFWTIDADRMEHYRYSNLIGPQLHAASAQR